jgi:predicted ATP-grasp superfamily ATP-dependent carboligase
MDIMIVLKDLLEYYTARGKRGVGHTTALLNGAMNTDNVCILAPTVNEGRDLIKNCSQNARFVTLNSSELLKGLRLPLMIDNSAMIEIISKSLNEIVNLNTQTLELLKDNSELHEKLDMIAAILIKG